MSKENPLIISFVADLLFASKIENVTRRLGYRTEWVEHAGAFGRASQTDRPGEPLVAGQLANLTSHLSRVQPHLLIFDLENSAIPSHKWIATIKSSPATRRIPILAFGSHIHTELLEKAHRVGADGVVTRGRFTEKLPDLINKYALRLDYAGILSACDQPLSKLALQGIDLFNQGEFYEAHHGLEDAWNADQTPVRDMYRGILQVAVAYLQIERGNYRGAVKMFLRVRQWLEPLPDVCRTVDIAQLRCDVEAAHAVLTQLGADNIAEFDRSLFKPINLIRNA